MYEARSSSDHQQRHPPILPRAFRRCRAHAVDAVRAAGAAWAIRRSCSSTRGWCRSRMCLPGWRRGPTMRAASSQKCVRAGGKHNDLDNVGYTLRHHTFFEMLGNFSFGDYFKVGCDRARMDFTHARMGDRSRAADRHRLSIPTTKPPRCGARSPGLPEARIVRIATNDNFWSMGDTGPCGPCSEIFYRSRAVGSRVGRRAASDRGRRPFRRNLESRVHAVRAGRCRQRASTCPARASIPAWGWNASPPYSRARPTISRPTLSSALIDVGRVRSPASDAHGEMKASHPHHRRPPSLRAAS